MKHILIVDDDVMAARVVAATLPEYDVTIAHDALEALRAAARRPHWDLLITDYFMPSFEPPALRQTVTTLIGAA